MQTGAHVTSLEALSGFRVALCLFRDEGEQALALLDAEIGRFVEWLEHDQMAFWRQEIRRREERLGEAKTDLHRCLAATIDPERTPSCYQEKKVVEAAKRALEEAEAKLAAVRRWIPIVRQAVFEYRLKIEPISSALTADLPRAVAALDATVARIRAYLDLSPPGMAESNARPSVPSEPVDASRASAALPAEESAADADSEREPAPPADSEKEI